MNANPKQRAIGEEEDKLNGNAYESNESEDHKFDP